MPQDVSINCTILGCGTSVGVPALGRIGWGKCDPLEPKNRRQRCALLIQTDTTTILVDAGPDIRNQLLPHGLEKLDAVLITHTHSDHVAGIDELRTFFFPDRIEVPVYASAKHADVVETRFPYMFKNMPESPSYFIPPLKMNIIAPDDRLEIGDVVINVMHQDHGTTHSLGFLFNNKIGYSTDVIDMPDSNFDMLSGVPHWIVECLRDTPHQSHLHFDKTMEWIDRVKPAHAYLTHLAPEADYQTFLAKCPEGVEPAYDGLQISA